MPDAIELPLQYLMELFGHTILHRDGFHVHGAIDALYFAHQKIHNI